MGLLRTGQGAVTHALGHQESELAHRTCPAHVRDTDLCADNIKVTAIFKAFLKMEVK